MAITLSLSLSLSKGIMIHSINFFPTEVALECRRIIIVK